MALGESTAVVLDLGSLEIKAGFAHGFPNEEEPRLVRRRVAAASLPPPPLPRLAHPTQSTR